MLTSLVLSFFWDFKLKAASRCPLFLSFSFLVPLFRSLPFFHFPSLPSSSVSHFKCETVLVGHRYSLACPKLDSSRRCLVQGSSVNHGYNSLPQTHVCFIESKNANCTAPYLMLYCLILHAVSSHANLY